MKRVFVALVFLSAMAHAQEALDLRKDGESRIKGYRFGACDYWQTIQGNSGTAYVCGFYPQRIVVADGYDVADALEAANARIASLEARVAALEQKPR